MKEQIVKGTTSRLEEIFIQDSSSTTGAGLTGLLFNTASLTAHYYRSGAAGETAITLATMTLGTWVSGGFIEIDATNMPGFYQLGLPDAAIVTGADKVVVNLKGAANMAQLPLEIQLLDVNFNDGVRGGMTALPNAAADAAGGLIISDLGGVDVDQMEADLITITGTGGADLSAAASLSIWNVLESAVVVASSMGIKLKNTLPVHMTKNTALANFSFLLVGSSDHVTPITGRTVTATRSIDGGAFGAATNSVSEIASGFYKIDLSAADLNGDVIVLRFTATDADDRFIVIITQAAAA